MPTIREIEEKIKCAEQYAAANQQLGQPQVCCNQTYRPSCREEAEKRIGHLRSEADKADRAVAFFRDHPEFDEFIQLIRQGVIEI